MNPYQSKEESCDCHQNNFDCGIAVIMALFGGIFLGISISILFKL